MKSNVVRRLGTSHKKRNKKSTSRSRNRSQRKFKSSGTASPAKSQKKKVLPVQQKVQQNVSTGHQQQSIHHQNLYGDEQQQLQIFDNTFNFMVDHVAIHQEEQAPTHIGQRRKRGYQCNLDSPHDVKGCKENNCKIQAKKIAQGKIAAPSNTGATSNQLGQSHVVPGHDQSGMAVNSVVTGEITTCVKNQLFTETDQNLTPASSSKVRETENQSQVATNTVDIKFDPAGVNSQAISPIDKSRDRGNLIEEKKN